MPISDLRDEFKELTGLINLSNTQIDRWINRGLRHLDITSNFKYAPGRQAQLIQAGNYQVNLMAELRILQSVWVVDTTDGRTRLGIVLKHEEFKTTHPNLPTETQGRPYEGVLTVVRGVDLSSVPGGLAGYDEYVETAANLSESDPALADGSFTADGSIIAAGVGQLVPNNIRGFMFASPADKEYMFEVFGKFLSVPLNDINIDNYWSLNHPDAVIAAALWKLYLLKYRNREAAADYYASMSAAMRELDYDDAEEQSTNTNVMEG